MRLYPFTVSVLILFLPVASIASSIDSNLTKTIQKMERASKGRIGIAAINTRNNRIFQYRAGECFPMCSTSKVMGVGAVLNKSRANKSLLQHKIQYTADDLAGYSPITNRHISDGLIVTSLCQAAISYSDNTAINLLIKNIGGIDAVNTFVSSIGDKAFRLDRLEPDLSSSIPGDLRDTTTPLGMAISLRHLVLGDALAPAERKLLTTWLIENQTGENRIRAGVPKKWIVADKTGTGDYGTTNDIAVIWPKGCAPIIITVFYTQSHKESRYNEKIIARATGAVIKGLATYDMCINKALRQFAKVKYIAS